MSTYLHLLMLSDRPGRGPREWRLHPDGSDMDAVPQGARCQRVLAVPGTELSLHRLALPAASMAQARAAALLQLQGRLATPTDQVTMAVAGDGATSWVAVFAHDRITDWLARAAGAGFVPDRIVPDCLLLPEPAGDKQVHVTVDDGYWRVRGLDFAFSTEAPLAQLQLDARSHQVVELAADALQHNLFDAATRPAVDLMTAAGHSSGPASGPGPSVRRLCLLAALVLVSPLLIWACQGLWHDAAAKRLQARNEQSLGAVVPDAVGGGSPLARARAAEARLSEPDRFARLVAPLLDALGQVPGMRLTQLTLGGDGVVEARVRHDASVPVDVLRDALSSRGIELAEVDSAPSESMQLTRILLSEAP